MMPPFIMVLSLDRVAGGCCQPQAPSEPYVTVSRHTAQAFIKARLCGATRLFSLTAFAIRTCSLLTALLTVFQSMNFHLLCLPKGASANLTVAVICFPFFKDSTDYLAIEHQPG